MTQGKIVLFDTNSYRKIVSEKNLEEILIDINHLKYLEKRKNIKASAIITVTTELLGNLANESDKYNYKDCLNSLIVMGKHCFDDEIETLKIIPTPYGHMSKSLFGFVPTEFETDLKNIASILNGFRKNSDNTIIHCKKHNTFSIAKEFLNKGESNFIENIINLINIAETVVNERHPLATKKQQRNKLLLYLKSDEFGSSFANAIVFMISNVLQTQLSNEEIFARAKFLSKEFPVSVGFFKFVCHKIVNQNIDLKTKLSRQKRWNWIWDYHVSFLCSDQKMDGRDVILVTSDNDMKKMLIELDFGHKIFDYESYKKYLLA